MTGSPAARGAGEARECGTRRPSYFTLTARGVGEVEEGTAGGEDPGLGDPPAGRPVDRRRVQLASSVRGASVMGYKRGGKYFSLLSRFALPRCLLVRR